MALTISVRFDPASQAALDRVSSSLAILTTSIGKAATTMSALKDSADALVAEVNAAINEIKDLADRLTAALAAGDPAEVAAVTAELTQAQASLKAAVDGATAPAAPASPAA
jgi:hypothetical protein